MKTTRTTIIKTVEEYLNTLRSKGINHIRFRDIEYQVDGETYQCLPIGFDSDYVDQQIFKYLRKKYAYGRCDHDEIHGNTRVFWINELVSEPTPIKAKY